MAVARLSPGAISESSSSHLPPRVASKVSKPVTFPLGRSSRATMPLATGSPTPAKTIGIVRVSRWAAVVAGVPPVRMTVRHSLGVALIAFEHVMSRRSRRRWPKARGAARRRMARSRSLRTRRPDGHRSTATRSRLTWEKWRDHSLFKLNVPPGCRGQHRTATAGRFPTLLRHFALHRGNACDRRHGVTVWLAR